MRVLITGGAGFIGSHVAEKSLEAGHEVLVIDDLSTGRRENIPPEARFVEVDIRDSERVEAVFAEFRPEVMSHQAAQTSVSVSTREPLRDAEVNVVGSLSLLEAAVRHGVERVVFASTGGAIYGEVPDGERAQVGWPTRPLSPYACSKMAIEGYLGAYRSMHGLDSTVLRYANVYGPRQDPHGEAGVVAIFSQRLVDGESIQINARRTEGDPGCVRDYVFVSDVVAANLKAIAGEIAPPIVNVCTGEATTTLDLARMLEAKLNVTAKLGSAGPRAGDLEVSVLEPSPEAPPSISLEAGIGATAEWFREKAS